MAWVRIDDHFTEHPKLVQAGPLGVAMQIAALCYANRHLTDGELPANIVARFMPTVCYDPETGEEITWRDVADRLVEIGIWHKTESGYVIHDYLEYQPSKADVEAERAAARERMARIRSKRKANQSRSSDDVRANIERSSPSPNPNPNIEEDDDKYTRARGDDPEWRALTLAVFGETFDRYHAEALAQDCEDLGEEVVKEAMRRTVERSTQNRLSYYRRIVNSWRGKVRSLDDLRKLEEVAKPNAVEIPMSEAVGMPRVRGQPQRSSRLLPGQDPNMEVIE